jgi:carboxypeptidase family protein/TonB-dependent receptor-like protein
MKRCMSVLALLLLCASVVHAQEQTGEIFGKVTDASGGVLPGVTVTVAAPNLLQPLVAVTSETGTYQFPRLDIGTYSVRFELTGFKTIVNEGIRVTVGFNAQVNAQMGIAGVQESITVTGQSPIVDTKATGTKQTFTNELLQSIPSARDPWVILEQTAGIAMDRANVGGSLSGQQSNFVARGANMSQQKWNLDGVDITDMNARGGSPMYFDFDALEEMQISTGGNDVTMQSPGVAVNLVTKSGTDTFRGSGRFYVTDQNLESVNLTDALRTQGATSGSPIQNVKDEGIEAGGPLVKGRAWIWGSFGKQDIKTGVNGFYQPSAACQTLKADLKAKPLSHSVNDIWNCLNTDLTTLNTSNLKYSMQTVKNNTFSFYFNSAGKIRNARDGSDTRPIETTYRQGGVTDDALGSRWWKTGYPKTYKFSDQHIVSDRLLFVAQFAHVGNNFVLDFHDPSLADVQASYDQNTGMYGRSYLAQTIVRPTNSVDLSANYFMPGTLGGDNAVKFGYKWRKDEAYTATHYGGNAWSVFSNGAPFQAWIYRDGVTDYFLHDQSFYGQDTWTRGRVVVNIGFRWDYQTDEAAPATVGTVPFYGQTTQFGQTFNQLPTVTFAGAKSGVAWKNFSPRGGASFDLSDDGRNIAKANYSRYVDQLGTGTLSGTYNPVKVIELDYPWTDLNSDGFVQANEIDMRGAPAFATSGYDYNNPSLLTTTGKIDPSLVVPKTDEMVLTYDRQLGKDVAVSASFMYRRYSDFFNTSSTTVFRPGMTSADWTAKTYTPNCTTAAAGSRCQPVTYYAPNFQLPVGTLVQNTPDYHRTYRGLELAFRKRVSNRWALNSSYTFNTNPEFFESPAAYLDPTNIATQNGAQYAEQSTTSGLDNVFVNTRWIYRASGTYTLPWDVDIAAFYNARGGYPFEPTVQTTSRGNGAGAVGILLDPPGAVRLPNFQQLDMRVDRPVKLGTMRAILTLDVFNLFNENTVMAQRRTQNASNANQIANILAPRVARLGVRVTW